MHQSRFKEHHFHFECVDSNDEGHFIHALRVSNNHQHVELFHLNPSKPQLIVCYELVLIRVAFVIQVFQHVFGQEFFKESSAHLKDVFNHHELCANRAQQHQLHLLFSSNRDLLYRLFFRVHVHAPAT